MADIYEKETYEPDKSLGQLLQRLRTELLAAHDQAFAANEHLSALEVSSAQFMILAGLALRQQEVSAADLCRGISYDPGAMTRMIDRLESKGLLRRKRCPEDRRIVYLELTAHGRELFESMRELSMHTLNRFLRGFTTAEVRQLEGFLNRMLENA